MNTPAHQNTIAHIDRNSILNMQIAMLRHHEAVSKDLKKINGVKSIGIGPKEVNNALTKQLSYRVYIDQKKSLAALDKKEIIPPTIFGFATDIIEDSSYNHYLDTTQYRPLEGGGMIKNSNYKDLTDSGAATIGCIARKTDDTKVGLTCFHAISGGFSPVTDVGYAIGQPVLTTVCCCCNGNSIGDLGTTDSATDSAIIILNAETNAELSTSALENTIHGVGEITGAEEAACFDEVEKYGAATEHTEGVIIDIRYDGNKMLISPLSGEFAAPGDSGAVIVKKSNKKVLGLLIGGLRDANSVGVAHHIGPVMTAHGIKIAGQAVGTLAVPTTPIPAATPTAITAGRNWMDQYDNTSLTLLVAGGPVPGLGTIPPNTTDFNSQAERDERQDAVDTLIGIPNQAPGPLTIRWNNRRIQAENNNVLDHPELPFHTTPVGNTQLDDNDFFTKVEHLATYQQALYLVHFRTGIANIDFFKLREGFQLFANGNLRTFPPPAGSILSVILRAGGPGGLREPNGAFMLMFAEFAFLCIENANNTNKPTNDLNGPIWLEIARIVVGMQELYPHVYKNTAKSIPPDIVPLGSGAFTMGPNARDYNGFLPSHFNDASSSPDVIAALSATSSLGQSSNERRARVNHKYRNMDFSQLKEAMKENIQQMLRIG